MLKCFQTHVFTAALFRGTRIPQLKTRSKFNGNLYRNASLPVTNQFYGFKFKYFLLYLRQSHCLISTDSWNEGYFPNFPYSCWNNVITFASWRVPLCMYWQNAPIPRCEWSRAFLNTVSYAQGELSVFKAICYLILRTARRVCSYGPQSLQIRLREAMAIQLICGQPKIQTYVYLTINQFSFYCPLSLYLFDFSIKKK